MINIKSFVEGIHTAILGASQSLMQQHLDLLETYFEGGQTAKSAGSSAPSQPLRARSVVVEYPQQTANGLETVEVHVPLITLVPISLPQVEKAKLTADFQLRMVDNQLQMLFPNEGVSEKGLFGKAPKGKGTYGTLEITLGPTPLSEGMKDLVEGYEKALKAQIPH